MIDQLFLKRLYRTALVLAVFSLALTLASGAAAAPKLTALIIDGQNNHDWKATTPVLKVILEETGLFTVDVATSPPGGKPMDDYKPAFSKYDVLVMNYTGDSWCDETKKAFVDYMENGGGLVIFHAADNAFPQWKEFNEMIALGGWGGRDEKSGPMVRYRDGEMVLDHSPGRGGTHGAQWAFPVETVNARHPIMKGLPKAWRHAPDELYAKMRGPAKNMTLLSVAKSRLTQEYEPILFTVQYGKGRVFHTMLGHAAEQMRSVGFAFTLQRGTEWAATGKVTLKVPDEFPMVDQVSLRLHPMSLEAIKQYEFGASRKAVTIVEENIRIATPKQLEKIEMMLLDVLKDNDATYRGKLFACRMLRRMGTDKSINTFAKLLSDESLSDPVRFALQGIASKKVDRVFRRALGKLDGDLKIGVIGSIAERGDRQAVSSLLKLIQHDNTDIARAAIAALGKIGTVKVALALSKTEVPESLDRIRYDSILLCADGLLAGGKNSRAKSIYDKLTGDDVPAMIRLAAYRGIIQTDRDKAVSTILALLKDSDADLCKAAAGPFLREVPGSEVTEALAGQLSSFPSESQVMVLAALAARGDQTALPATLEAARSSDEAVQIAAIQALTALGDGSVVDRLAQLVVDGGKIGEVAEQTLSRMGGEGVDKAILNCLESSNAKIRIAAVQSLVARHNNDAVPALLKHTSDPDAQVRKESLSALTELAREDDIPALLKLAVKTETPRDIRLIEETVLALAEPMKNANKRTRYLLSQFDNAPDTAKVSLIRLLGKFGGRKSFDTLKGAMDDPSESVRNEALRALQKWPDTSALRYLMTLAENTSDDKQRSKAIWGCIHAIELPSTRTIKETLKLYADTMALAKSKSNKASIVEALGERADFETLDYLEGFLEDKDVADEAREAFGAMIKKLSASDLDRSEWKVKSSHNSREAKNAIDDNQNSRWSSNTSQVPGIWFTVDLGSQRQIERIKLDTTQSSRDYPRGYTVYLSNDGENWGEPVIEGKGTKAITEIPLDFRSGRFVKILQTGKVNGLHWSIHEMWIDAVFDTEKLKSAKEKLEHLESK